MVDRALVFLSVGAVLLGVGTAVSYFTFTVDDAYIVLRYASNVWTQGELVFNPGERVTTLTSPLHALLTAVLYGAAGECALQVNKALMMMLVGVSAWLLIRGRRVDPLAVVLVLAIVFASPFIWMWAVEGLETMLVVCVITAIAGLYMSADRGGAFIAINVLAGVAFLARYDTVFFVLPVLMGVWKLVPQWCERVLDVGCATGSVGRLLKESRGRVHVTGVELDPTMAELARHHLDDVAVGDIRDVLDKGSLGSATFDCILLADVLEYLVDPWAILRRLTDHLEPKGIVVTSLQNVRHYTTLLSLLLGKRWPYQDRGIHDRTHLRFFAQRNLPELFQSAGLTITSLRRQYRVVEAPYRFNRYSRVLAVPPLRDLLTFQYLIVASAPSRAAES